MSDASEVKRIRVFHLSELLCPRGLLVADESPMPDHNSELLPVSEHDAVVAELKAEIENMRANEKSWLVAKETEIGAMFAGQFSELKADVEHAQAIALERKHKIREQELVISELEDRLDGFRNREYGLENETELKAENDILKSKVSQFESTLKETIRARDEAKARLAEAEAVIEFYANKNNWLRDANGWRHDMIVKDLDDETLQDWDGRFSGRTARAYLEKFKD